MKKLTFKDAGFSIVVPEAFTLLGKGCLFFSKSGAKSSNEIVAPNGGSLIITHGKINPIPSPEKHLDTIVKIARKYGHDVIKTSFIEVLGKKHATIVYEVPVEKYSGLMVIRFKNYHLIFNTTEYILTAKLAQLKAFSPKIMQSNPALFMSLYSKYNLEIEQQQEIYGYEEDYDDIVKKFELT